MRGKGIDKAKKAWARFIEANPLITSNWLWMLVQAKGEGIKHREDSPLPYETPPRITRGKRGKKKPKQIRRGKSKL